MIIMKEKLGLFTENFLKCGLAGWCMEILFTSMDALRRRDLTLKGSTSLWMFPIYGSAAVLSPVCRLLGRKSFWTRGLTYMALIFSGEYLSGILLSKRRLCPWDYGRSRWNISRIIRLDYAPCWFCAGLLFERLILPTRKKTRIPHSSGE